jgi:hypothetical protein
MLLPAESSSGSGFASTIRGTFWSVAAPSVLRMKLATWLLAEDAITSSRTPRSPGTTAA